MGKQSAGLLVYRITPVGPQVLLVHPGGPFYKNKDAGVWSIPKGEYAPGEDELAVARKEFTEETGQSIDGEFLPLMPVKQKGGKIVTAWAIAADVDISVVTSNTFQLEWPPRSGRKQEFPEVDKAEWFTMDEAREKILQSQLPFIDQLEQLLKNK